ncbi:hypothetical protein R5W24_005107 [Gemmata sp. JC717]|uniref:HEAT repeat domain-containing protein n=1 Tax=Gemmata algarum TaxID=2975278 RepID=UPI0021BB421A|nr:HEAT repeat domain-containing protein [Gemmata algarum]MDY3555961.1 hypothetical protein [Gemmata algarum]
MICRRSSLFAALAAGTLLVPATAFAQEQAVQPPQLVLPALPQPVPAPPTPTVAPTFGQQSFIPVAGLAPQPAPRFNFKIDPSTPVKDLLPVAPKAAPARGPLLADDLNKVPEIEFEARADQPADHGKLTERTAHQLAKINHMNAKKADAFMGALIESRADLAGMPFVMGDDCRSGPERAKHFAAAVALVRRAMQSGGSGRAFWTNYNALCEQQEEAASKSDKALKEQLTVTRIAALTQMLAPEPAEMRAGLVKHLTGVPHVEATRALARLAVFSPEDDLRFAAVDALKVRREKDYTDVLVKALRYPFPAVARRAADAIARLERADLTGELVAVLDEGDPRLPQAGTSGRTQFVREMVKVNHHRNCMMCHAPGTSATSAGSDVTAEVPVPGEPLPAPSQGYRQSSPDLMVRIDVTYLRQDFSARLTVPDAQPWPDQQRFDFFVRERAVSDEEAGAYREKLTPKEPGVLSPYHKAALAALRELTGKDTAPTAAAWRKLLDTPAQPAPQSRRE